MPAPKPPRVYIKDGIFYLSYWQGSREVRSTTGLRADVEFIKGNTDWWKASIHQEKIEKQIEIAVANRTAHRYGQQVFIHEDKLHSVPSLETTASLYAEHWKKRHNGRPLEPGTRRKFITAINRFHAFNKHLGLLNTTDKDAQDFRQWLQAKKYQDITSHSYVRRLKTLWRFAIDREYLKSNPWKDVTIEYEDKIIIPARIEDEKKFFCIAFRDNRRAFEFAFFQRMTAYRFSDSLHVYTDSIQNDVLLLRNVKMKRPDAYPICPALQYLLDHREKPDRYKGRIFYYSSTTKYNLALSEICSAAGISPRFTSKSFKPNFGQELDNMILQGRNVEDRFIALLMHHKIMGPTKIASRHYIQHLPQMRRILTESFDHWYTFIKGLYEDYEAECEKWRVKIKVDFSLPISEV